MVGSPMSQPRRLSQHSRVAGEPRGIGGEYVAVEVQLDQRGLVPAGNEHRAEPQHVQRVGEKPGAARKAQAVNVDHRRGDDQPREMAAAAMGVF